MPDGRSPFVVGEGYSLPVVPSESYLGRDIEAVDLHPRGTIEVGRFDVRSSCHNLRDKRLLVPIDFSPSDARLVEPALNCVKLLREKLMTHHRLRVKRRENAVIHSSVENKLTAFDER
jgi:hypothetical protein